MTLNLIKLCVGVESITHLRDLQAARLERQREAGDELLLKHRTRQTPRRREQVLDGGSLYWVIKGVIQVRQQIVDLREARGEDGINRCDIVLDTQLIATRTRRRRAFQGWRYFEPDDAPPDIGEAGANDDDMPPELKAELMELGLL